MKKNRNFILHLNDDDVKWITESFEDCNFIKILSVEEIKRCFHMFEIEILSPSELFNFFEKNCLWERLYFYENRKICSLLSSKYTGIVYN